MPVRRHRVVYQIHIILNELYLSPEKTVVLGGNWTNYCGSVNSPAGTCPVIMDYAKVLNVRQLPTTCQSDTKTGHCVTHATIYSNRCKNNTASNKLTSGIVLFFSSYISIHSTYALHCTILPDVVHHGAIAVLYQKLLQGLFSFLA